jgi:hypothetical protein
MGSESNDEVDACEATSINIGSAIAGKGGAAAVGGSAAAAGRSSAASHGGAANVGEGGPASAANQVEVNSSRLERLKHSTWARVCAAIGIVIGLASTGLALAGTVSVAVAGYVVTFAALVLGAIPLFRN